MSMHKIPLTNIERTGLVKHGLDKQLSEMQPSYPTCQIIGSCVCGSWPGGECLKCEWIPSKDKAVKEST